VPRLGNKTLESWSAGTDNSALLAPDLSPWKAVSSPRRPPGLPRSLPIFLAVLFMTSCLGAQKKAVEQAIQDHLKQNRSLVAGSYSTKIERISVTGNNADALVRFESRQNTKLVVEVEYGLRVENGQWEVVTSTQVGGLGGDSRRPRDGNLPTPPGTQPGLAPQPSH